MSCVFCAIVAGEAPAIRIYEDDEYLAILDIRPFWTADASFIFGAAATASLTFCAARSWEIPSTALLIADACGLVLLRRAAELGDSKSGSAKPAEKSVAVLYFENL